MQNNSAQCYLKYYFVFYFEINVEIVDALVLIGAKKRRILLRKMGRIIRVDKEDTTGIQMIRAFT